jgi:hypothetical protein
LKSTGTDNTAARLSAAAAFFALALLCAPRSAAQSVLTDNAHPSSTSKEVNTDFGTHPGLSLAAKTGSGRLVMRIIPGRNPPHRRASLFVLQPSTTAAPCKRTAKNDLLRCGAPHGFRAPQGNPGVVGSPATPSTLGTTLTSTSEPFSRFRPARMR